MLSCCFGKWLNSSDRNAYIESRKIPEIVKMKHITIETIGKVCNGTLHFVKEEEKQREAQGVVLDSRLVKEGYIFIATKGERVDGHSFIPQVFEKKAMAVICEELPTKNYGTCILVKDSFQALKDLAEYYRSLWSIPVIGITGSVGKTSTKEFIAGVLSTKYRVGKTQGNYNNEVGLPLTILSIKEEHEVAVLEMGISDFGEMHRLSKIAKPDICILTNIGQCHLENLGDRDGVLKAKSEIFDFLSPEGRIYVNGDDDKLTSLKEKWKERLLTFGRGEENDLIAYKESSMGLLGSCCSMKGLVELKDLKIHLPGEHMILNALAATAVALQLGLTQEEIKEGMEKVERVSGRSNIIPLKDCIVIDDCYNANPVSMKSAIDLLQKAQGRRIAILGDMFELGEKEKELHYQIGAYAVKKADILFCIGTLSFHMYEGAQNHKDKATEIFYLEEKEKLYHYLEKIKKRGDTFLIKASHGMGFSEIISWMEANFS